MSARKPPLLQKICDEPPQFRRDFGHGTHRTGTTERLLASNRPAFPTSGHRRPFPSRCAARGGRNPQEMAALIVVVTKQDRPVLRVLLGNPAPHAFAAIVDHRLLAAPAIGIGASVDRVGQNLGDPPRRGRNPPHQTLAGGTDREFDRVAMKREKHLPDAAKLSELAEHQMDRITLALVRCHLDSLPCQASLSGHPVFLWIDRTPHPLV